MEHYLGAGEERSRFSPQIEMRPPAALRPNPRNARTRTKREVRRIADSIRSAGNLQPIVVDESDVILAGHGRLAAAKVLGLEMVPTIKAVGLTDAQKRLFAIADNKLTENAGWDREVLAKEFAELSELLERRALISSRPASTQPRSTRSYTISARTSRKPMTLPRSFKHWRCLAGVTCGSWVSIA